MRRLWPLGAVALSLGVLLALFLRELPVTASVVDDASGVAADGFADLASSPGLEGGGRPQGTVADEEIGVTEAPRDGELGPFIRGRVLMPHHQAPPKALRVAAWEAPIPPRPWMDVASAQVEPSGEFALSVPVGSAYQVRCTGSLDGAEVYGYSELVSPPAEVVIPLSRAEGRLGLTILGSGGAPLAGAQIRGLGDGVGLEGPVLGESNASGFVDIRNLQLRPLSVVVFADGYAPLQRHFPISTSTSATIQLDEGNPLLIRVLLPDDGGPCVGTRVHLHHASGVEQVLRTDAQGRVQARQPSNAGVTRIGIDEPGYASVRDRVGSDSGEHITELVRGLDVRFVCKPGVMPLHLAIQPHVGPQALPLLPIRASCMDTQGVVVRDLPRQAHLLVEVTDAQGRSSFKRFAVGTLVRDGVAEVELQPPAEDADRGRSVTLRLAGGGGATRTALVRVREDATPDRRFVDRVVGLGDDPVVVWRPRGRTLTVTPLLGGRELGPPTVVSPGQLRAEIRLPETRVISGEVVTGDLEPAVLGARVLLLDDELRELSWAQVGADGRFELVFLASWGESLLVRAHMRGWQPSEPQAVRAGDRNVSLRLGVRSE